MRIITRRTLFEFAQRYPAAAVPLDNWYRAAKNLQWSSIAQVRETYRHADAVVVGSGRIVTVFNIGANKFRLVTAIHYNTKILFVLRVLTHAEYDKDRWKKEL